MNKYVVTMNFNTDGDFSWDVVPAGFNVDLSEWASGENYSFDRVFYSASELDDWAKNYLPILKEHLHAEEYVKNMVVNLLKNLEDSIDKKETAEFHMSGNYSGTSVMFFNKGDNVDLNISVPNELYQRMKNVDISRDDLIDGINYIINTKEK